MSVAILILTHNEIGQAMIDTARSMMAEKSIDVNCLSIPANLKPEDLGYYADRIRNEIKHLNSNHGILILCDICGATPNNLARYFADQEDIRIISGLNLPMLLRVLNYRDKPLSELTSIALEGGHKGIQQD